MTQQNLLICIALLSALITLIYLFKFSMHSPNIEGGSNKWGHFQEIYKKALDEDSPSLVKGQLRWKMRVAEKGTVMRQVQDRILNIDHEKMKSNYVIRWEDEKLPPVNGPKKILYFNDFVERYDYHFGEGSEPFVRAGCPQTNCFATSNRSLLRVEDADAIVWNQRSKNLGVLPENISKHTRLIYFMMESPNYLVLDLNKYSNLFNYTMTYTHHSDLFNPYGIFVRREIPLPPSEGKNYAAGRTKLAVWFTSYCETANSRISLGHNLQEHIPIDIFGNCGVKKYPKEDNINPDDTLKAMEKEYKFYISFENSLCKNYITEKFFKAMRWKPKYESLFHYKEHTPVYNQMAWCQLCDKLNSDFTPQTYRSIAAYHNPYDQCLVGGDSLVLRYTTREKVYRSYTIGIALILSTLLFVLYKLYRRQTNLPY